MTHESWSAYWRRGEPTTLNFFREAYTGELAEFWHALVDALPDAARVLDLATGNGAVAVVVERRSRSLGRRLRIEAVDVAQIDPVAHAGSNPHLRDALQAIHFHPCIPLECTGLAAGAYQLVTSQYGIEYGDLPGAIAEVARLLSPGGRFGAILHSADSNVTRTAANIDRLMRLLLQELELPERVRRLLAGLADVRDGAGLARSRSNPRTATLWVELEAAVLRARRFAAVDEQMRGTAHGFLQQVLAPLNEAVGEAPERRLALLGQTESEALHLQQRMGALRACALDADQLDRFCDGLRAAGLVPEPPRLVQFGPQREAMGHGVVARRP